MTTQINKSAQIQEIMKCGRDPVYFINTYCKIMHPTRGPIPFKTYGFQEDCVKKFIKHRFNIVLKSRQLGLSTITAAYCVWFALFHKAKEILIIATKLNTAVNFIKKVKVMLKSIPTWLCISPFEATRQEVRFKNGSRIQAIPTSDDAGRSEALSLLIVDEAAFIKNFENIWTGIYPTISTGGNAIILSTPNGVGGQYYKLYTDAESGENEFNPIKLMWYVHPEHDQAWFDKEIKQFSRRKVAQELLCEFLGSGETYISPDDLAFLEKIKKEPIAKGSDNCTPEERKTEKDVWIWAHPKMGVKYILSADVSRGDAKDFSTFHIFNGSTGDVDVEYKGKIAPDKFAYLIEKYGKKYNNAYVCPENNTFGYTTCTKLVEFRYPKLIYQNVRLTQIDTFVPSPGDPVGFSTQAKSKELALSKLEEHIRNKTIKFYSARMLNELRTFIWTGSKACAMKDEHDDLVMSGAIGSWIFDGIFGVGQGQTSDALVLLNAMTKATTNFSSVPGNGQDVVAITHQAIMPYVTSRPQNPNSKVADINDYSWVVK